MDHGFNTVRTCAMPFLLFSGRVQDPDAICIRGLGKDFGQRTRWYDVRGSYRLDGRRRLLELFEAARRHNCRLIVSSWEYQQSPCFADTDLWHRALAAVPTLERSEVMAQAMADLLDFLSDHGLADRIAYVEVHNEVASHYGRLFRPLTRAMDLLKARHPHIPATYSLGETWPEELGDLPDGQVAHFHFYVYGVLGALYEAVGLGHGTQNGRRTRPGPRPTSRPCCGVTRRTSTPTIRTSPGNWPQPAYPANCSTPTTG
ncbi:hypothetical protein NGB36_30780 [Streptomyces sp. RB6PN25]|uniref:Uncharacterized protein n=1 Tax=Streptomyces humicola TaxID=2953240 RepID=A0ABT1Q4M0_9ACTN|nr:hypothetical protein [Streptomyces humicola]MCQ4084834.1 hypothetical protein [Streptomyces humicola]